MDDAFELSSQTDLNTGKGMTRATNKVWRGDQESEGTHCDDSTSEDAVLEPSEGRIMKTVSVTVMNVRDNLKVSMERENSVVRFELSKSLYCIIVSISNLYELCFVKTRSYAAFLYHLRNFDIDHPSTVACQLGSNHISSAEQD
jgi:hypothetical protein